MRTSRRATVAHEGWTSEVASGFALAGFLALVFVAFTLLAMGPMMKFDAYFNLDVPPAGWLPFLHGLDRIGQRAVCLPILGVFTFMVCRRQESWRPAVVAVVSVFSLNLVVLILKVVFARSEPLTADPSFFAGGLAYPSGHSANIVLVYGLVAYLLSRYYSIGRKTQALLWGIVAVLSVTMVVTSMTLNWHWFADLIAGILVGAIVLELTATIDRAVPAAAFADGWRRGVRPLVGAVRAGKSRGHEGPA